MILHVKSQLNPTASRADRPPYRSLPVPTTPSYESTPAVIAPTLSNVLLGVNRLKHHHKSHLIPPRCGTITAPQN